MVVPVVKVDSVKVDSKVVRGCSRAPHYSLYTSSLISRSGKREVPRVGYVIGLMSTAATPQLSRLVGLFGIVVSLLICSDAPPHNTLRDQK